ncbi:MAG TPA: ABC transporter permease [Pyrinomonadaceae bacterium]
MHTFWQDLRYGLHVLWKNPGFTTIAVLTLALGIGANTALFSVVDAVLLKKLPAVQDPDRLALFNSVSNRQFTPGSHNGVNRTDPATGLTTRSSFPYQTFVRLREQRGACSDIIAFGAIGLNVNADGLADFANAQAVTGNYYEVLGVRPFLGRMITYSDDNSAASPVAVISYRYWQKRFSGRSDIIGKQINLNNVAFTIAGVGPPGFEGAMDLGSSMDVAIPLGWETQVSGDRSEFMGAGDWWLRIMGRLKPGATIEQAQASLDPAFQQSALEHREARQIQRRARGQQPVSQLDPKDYPHLAAISGSRGEMSGRRFFVKPLQLLLGVVAVVLLISCANVANLLLVRASSRQKEIAVRLAMGASRWRLIRQLLTESVLLSTLGGAVGILIALWLKDSLLSVGEWAGRENSLNPRLDMRVLAFTFGLSLVTGIVFGIVPAWRATRVDLTPALKDTGRGSSATTRSLLSRSLVVAQVSLSLLLLIGAGLLVRTLINLQKVEPGFNEENLLLFNVDPSLLGYKDDRLLTFYQQVFARVEAVPGVRAVTFSRVPLLSQMSANGTFDLPGAKPGPDGTVPQTAEVFFHNVRENFFEAMGIPLLSGRNFTAKDDLKAPKVAIVNQTFAQRYLAGGNPVGKRFSLDIARPDDIEIIGVVKDAKYTSQRDEIPATMYRSWLQTPAQTNSMFFEVRTMGDPKAYVGAIRQAVRDVEPNLPLNNIKTQIEQADETLSMERLFAKLMSLFGLLAQQLASIGLYGVLAYSVSRRTHEIGIRMALGANRGRMLTMILRQGMTLTLIGAALGVAGGYVLTKYLESLTSMLFGVQPRDPLTFGAAVALLTIVALVACFIPARRATKVDPIVALRYE